jgi:hypothetical protein
VIVRPDAKRGRPAIESGPAMRDTGLVSAARQRPWPTYPSPKYGPTAEYGPCEKGDCRSEARTTCPECEGHFCLGHVAHDSHADT